MTDFYDWYQKWYADVYLKTTPPPTLYECMLDAHRAGVLAERERVADAYKAIGEIEAQ